MLTHLFARRHEANHSTIGDYSRGKWVVGGIAGNTQANGGRGVRHVRFWPIAAVRDRQQSARSGRSQATVNGQKNSRTAAIEEEPKPFMAACNNDGPGADCRQRKQLIVMKKWLADT